MPKNLLYLKLLFPTKYKITFITVFSFDLIFLLLGLFIRDFCFFITISVILLLQVTVHLASSRTVLKQLMNQQIERFNKDVIYFDLVFEENELYAKSDSSTNKVPIKYKDLKKINETDDIVFFTSNAGFKIYFEKKNASSEDIERLHAFFDKQNIKWRKSIL